MNTLKTVSRLEFYVDFESDRYQNRKLKLKKLQKIIMLYNICKIKKSFGTVQIRKIYQKSLNTYFLYV